MIHFSFRDPCGNWGLHFRVYETNNNWLSTGFSFCWEYGEVHWRAPERARIQDCGYSLWDRKFK